MGTLVSARPDQHEGHKWKPSSLGQPTGSPSYENRFNPFMRDQIFGVANRKYYSDQSLFICTLHIKVLASEAIV